MASPNRSPGVLLFLALGVISFTLAPIFVRLAGDVPGLAIAVWRTVIAAVVLLPVAAVRVTDEVRALPRRDWLLIGAAGVLLGVHFIAWIESLFYTSVASSSVLVTTNPLFVALLGFLVLRERLAPVTVASIAGGVAGAALIGWADAGTMAVDGRALFGNGLALTAAVLVAVYLLIGRVVRQGVSWLAYVTLLYSVTAVTTLIAAVLFGIPLFGYSWTFYGICAVLALGPQILGHGSFNYAVKSMPTAIVGMLALIEPVGASLLAYVLFDEVPPPLSMAGMVLVLISVSAVILFRRRAASEPVSEAGESPGERETQEALQTSSDRGGSSRTQ